MNDLTQIEIGHSLQDFLQAHPEAFRKYLHKNEYSKREDYEIKNSFFTFKNGILESCWHKFERDDS